MRFPMKAGRQVLRRHVPAGEWRAKRTRQRFMEMSGTDAECAGQSCRSDSDAMSLPHPVKPRSFEAVNGAQHERGLMLNKQR